MSFKRTPFVIMAGFCLAALVLCIVGSTTAPSIAFADGTGGETIPMHPGDTIDNNNGYSEEDPNSSDLSILLLTISLLSTPL